MRTLVNSHFYGARYHAGKIVAFLRFFGQHFCIMNLALLYCVLAILNHTFCCKEQQEKCKNHSSRVDTYFPRFRQTVEFLFETIELFVHDMRKVLSLECRVSYGVQSAFPFGSGDGFGALLATGAGEYGPTNVKPSLYSRRLTVTVSPRL